MFPLVASSGSYTVTVFENVDGTQYALSLIHIYAGVFDSASIADTFIVSVPVICLL